MEGSARIIIQEGGPPPPDPRILPLAPVRHAGDCHVDGGVILRGGGRPLKQAREASDTGAIRNRCITPFLLNGYPCFPTGISFAGAAPCVGTESLFLFSFLVKETVLRPPSVSVLRSTFFSFRKLITPSWISRYPVGKSRTPMSEYR